MTFPFEKMPSMSKNKQLAGKYLQKLHRSLSSNKYRQNLIHSLQLKHQFELMIQMLVHACVKGIFTYITIIININIFTWGFHMFKTYHGPNPSAPLKQSMRPSFKIYALLTQFTRSLLKIRGYISMVEYLLGCNIYFYQL